MNLKTPDLMIRDFTAHDVEPLHRIYSDPDVMEYLGGAVEDKNETREELEANGLSKDHTRYAVIHSRSCKFIGEVTYLIHDEDDLMGEAEIGWTIGKEDWNKGYAQQLTQALIEYAAKNGAKGVFLCCEEEQAVPIHIAEKFGMEYVGLEWGQAMYRKAL